MKIKINQIESNEKLTWFGHKLFTETQLAEIRRA